MLPEPAVLAHGTHSVRHGRARERGPLPVIAGVAGRAG